MKKYYIKMNNNKNYLSLGNVISTIKSVSNNKNAMQIEIFCSIFDENNINVTTVNNIGGERRIPKFNKHKKLKKLFCKQPKKVV